MPTGAGEFKAFARLVKPSGLEMSLLRSLKLGEFKLFLAFTLGIPQV